MMENPDLARWLMFEKPAIESGVEYDEDVKEKMWWEYKVRYLFPASFLVVAADFPLRWEIILDLQLLELSGLYYA